MNAKFMKVVKAVFTAAFLCLMFCGSLVAQEITATIVGTVRDANGAVVPGATVTLKDTSKSNSVVRTATTSDDGGYTFPSLVISEYNITVEAPNFKKSVQTEIKIEVGQRRTVDVTLEAGNIAETVTITSDQVAIDLQSATSGTVINGTQAREIPINNRNFVQLVTLAPGVSNDLADQVYVGTTNPDGQANTVNISVNGARSSQNTFTIDGADVTDRGSNLTIQAYPSVDSIGEFRVLRSLYPAESGRSGGGQVNIITRSGTGSFHGSVYEFIRNEAFNANNFLINSSTAPPFGRDSNGKAKRAPFRYNDFGFTIGGPIYFLDLGERNPGDPIFHKYHQTFFFFSEEARRDRRFTAASTVNVPTADLRIGKFPIDVCINRPDLGEPSCTGAFRLIAGSSIPSNFFSPAALAYVNGVYNKLPLPNAATATNPFGLVTSLPNVADFRQEIFKLDHRFNEQLSFYYRFENDKIPTVDGNALFSSGSGLPGVSTTQTNSPGRTHTFLMTYVPTSNMIIEGGYVFSYGAILSKNVGLLALTNTVVPVNLPFANQRDRIPTLAPASGTQAVNGVSNLTSFGPYDNFSDKDNFNGSLTWIFGNHTTKYGASYSLYRKNENALAGVNEGRFEGFAAGLPAGVTVSTLNSNYQRWASFLVGNATGFTQAHFDYTADLRQKTFEAFAQDEWRMFPNLTVYYGVRYSFFGGPWDRNGRLSNFDPAQFNPAQAVQVTGAGNRVVGTGNFFNGLIVNSQNVIPTANGAPTVSPWGKFITKMPKTDFAPRVGLAWDPFGKGKTSIRTGYGIYHEQVLNGTFEQNIGQNQPYQENATAGVTRLDNPAGAVSIASAALSVRAVQADWQTPYMQHWSLEVQHQLTKSTVITVGYFGSKGTNLIGTTELNDLRANQALTSFCAQGNAYYAQNPALVACQPAGYAFRGNATTTGNPNPGFTDSTILDQIRPFRGYRSIAIIEPRYGSSYHSLQISASHRFSGDSQAYLYYTFSKNLTNSPNDRSNAPQDTYNIDAEWQRAVLDRRHILSANYIYELPFYRHQRGFVGKILGGWQASGIVTYNTGLPFSAVTSSFDPAGLGFVPALVAGGRPNVTCDPNQNAPHTLQQYFNTACFALNPGATATGIPNIAGTAGRGIIEGPPTFRVDFTMAKNFRFSESIRVQLRAETYNIFNRTNFRGFSSLNVTSTLFGVIGSVRDPRTMQFAAKISF